MDSAKGKSKASRDEKLATAKLDEQIEKVSFFCENCFVFLDNYCYFIEYFKILVGKVTG